VIEVGAITELHSVHNYSSSVVTIANLENGYRRDCPIGRSTFIDYQWVPWCSKGSDFPGRHLEIIVSGVVFNAWQDDDVDGNWVRLSTAGFDSSDLPPDFKPARHFPGSALDGGDRNIEVAGGGALSLRNAAP
jgi:hypothetical protein